MGEGGVGKEEEVEEEEEKKREKKQNSEKIRSSYQSVVPVAP